ncbi:MAG: hypothetical protein ACPF99_00030 [Flavobacteriaceae bacterium]
MAKKSWEEKFNKKSDFEIKTIDRSFWGYHAGSKILIPTPLLIQEYINQIESGNQVAVERMRNDLAIEIGADFTCPMTTGIFLRVVAEVNYERLTRNNDSEISPFWRVVDPKSKLADKLSFGKEIIIEKRAAEQAS